MCKSLIQSDPSIMMGKPVVKGTRITVEHILEKLADGESIDQINGFTLFQACFSLLLVSTQLFC